MINPINNKEINQLIVRVQKKKKKNYFYLFSLFFSKYLTQLAKIH